MQAQNSLILEYMRQYGSITPAEAMMHFACMRLSGRIYELKAQGHNIQTIITFGINRFGKKIRFARYVLNDAD